MNKNQWICRDLFIHLTKISVLFYSYCLLQDKGLTICDYVSSF